MKTKLTAIMILVLLAGSFVGQPSHACFWCDPVGTTKKAIKNPKKAIKNVGTAASDVGKTTVKVLGTAGSSASSDPSFGSNFGGRSKGVENPVRETGGNPHYDPNCGRNGNKSWDDCYGTDDENNGLVLPHQTTGSY